MAASSTAARTRRRARTIRMLAYVASVLALLSVASELILAASPLWRGGDVARVPADLLAQVLIAGPALFFVWGLRRARRLFRRIEAGEIFTEDNGRDFGRIGWSVFGGAAWSLTLGGLAPPQTSALALELAGIGAGARDLALLALGLALVVIGQLMAEARRLKAESDSFL